jgi:hypothetical protein
MHGMNAQRDTRRAVACVIAAAALAAGAAPAVAADGVVGTAARPTTIDAYAGRAVWSAWDASARAFRLTESAGGRVRTLPVRPSRVAFDVDLGPGPRGGTIAVYSRCRRPPVTTWTLNGRRGCDLYAYDFARGRETRLARANSRADERWPTVWRSRLAFTRTYTPARGRSRRFLYWRPLEGRGASHRLARGPLDRGGAIPEQLDLNGRRLAFVWTYEYGADVRLDTIGGRGRRLVRIPGSGAAANQLAAQGPTIAGGAVSWALAVGGDAPVFSEIRRHDLSSGRNTRATARIEAEPTARRATEGFAQAGGASWYVRTAGRASYEIHRATGLVYEPAPPIRLE